MVMDREASSWALEHVKEMINELRNEYTRPSVVFRAKLYRIGNGRWTAYYGDPKEEGPDHVFRVTGNSPDEAMHNFDKLWIAKPENKQV